MKVLKIYAVIVLLSLCAFGQEKSKDDISILKPADASFADAMNAATMLKGYGLNIKSIHRSKLEGFFRGVSEAAFFKTDKGSFEIIFFPEPNQAERIKPKEQRDGKRYIYSFEGQPLPNPPNDIFNAAFPTRFISKNNWFIVVFNNNELADDLEKILL